MMIMIDLVKKYYNDRYWPYLSPNIFSKRTRFY